MQFKFNPRRLPRNLHAIQSERDPITSPESMPLVRQIELLLFDAYQDTSLTTTHLMSIIVVCVMYLRSRALPDFLRDRLMSTVDFAEHVLHSNGLKNPRTLKPFNMTIATSNPDEEPKSIKDMLDEDMPDDISGLDTT